MTKKELIVFTISGAIGAFSVSEGLYRQFGWNAVMIFGGVGWMVNAFLVAYQAEKRESKK